MFLWLATLFQRFRVVQTENYGPNTTALRRRSARTDRRFRSTNGRRWAAVRKCGGSVKRFTDTESFHREHRTPSVVIVHSSDVPKESERTFAQAGDGSGNRDFVSLGVWVKARFGVPSSTGFRPG